MTAVAYPLPPLHAFQERTGQLEMAKAVQPHHVTLQIRATRFFTLTSIYRYYPIFVTEWPFNKLQIVSPFWPHTINGLTVVMHEPNCRSKLYTVRSVWSAEHIYRRHLDMQSCPHFHLVSKVTSWSCSSNQKVWFTQSHQGYYRAYILDYSSITASNLLKCSIKCVACHRNSKVLIR